MDTHLGERLNCPTSLEGPDHVEGKNRSRPFPDLLDDTITDEPTYPVLLHISLAAKGGHALDRGLDTLLGAKGFQDRGQNPQPMPGRFVRGLAFRLTK